MKLNGTIKLFADAHVFDNEYQGSRTFLKELYNMLAQKKGLQLYLGAYDIENLKQYFPEKEGVFFIQYKHKRSVWRLLFDIPSLIKKYQIDYAHFQYITPLKKNCRFIVTTHDVIFNDYPSEFSFWYRKTKNFLYKFSAKKADILTTVSEFSKQSIQKYFSIEAQKINVLPHGVNIKFFEDYNKQQAQNHIRNKYGFDKFILFVSRLEPRKNHVLLLKAYLDLRLFMQGFHLVLIGHETVKMAAFDILLENLPKNIRRYIFLSDSINDAELLDFYKAATAFIYPSKAEGFGMPPLEAGALQVPVLCSNSSSLSDFSFFNSNHIDTTDYDFFKQKLSAIVNNRPDELSLGNIRSSIKENYCWQKTADQFYQLLQQNTAQ